MDPDRLDTLMSIALEEAQAALAHDDVPIGAVVARLDDAGVVARRHNERELAQDPAAHAEILALRDAATARRSWRLDDTVLVVTLEPCAMCAGAAVSARIGLLAFGVHDPKAGACGSLYNLSCDPRLNHEFDVITGVRAEASSMLLKDFFARRRTPGDR